MVVHTLTNLNQIPPNTLAVIKFQAQWCSPCIIFKPKFLDLSEQVPHVLFFDVNVEDEASQELNKFFDIYAMPTIAFYKNGQILTKVFGAGPQEIQQMRTALSQFSIS